MLRFIICEDNKEFMDKMSKIINKVMMPHNFEYKINKFQEYNKEIEELIKNDIDQKIYILDIELPNISGLEIASEIRSRDLDSIIIFITSHPEFKNDIFYSRLLAIDYINKNQLWQDRFEETIKHSFKNINKKRILTFEFNHNSYRLQTNKINYIEKIQDNQKCRIHMTDGSSYDLITTIIELEKQLGSNFYRSHKSCLVNIDNIKRINYADNTITFQNDESLYLISNRNKKGLKEHVANY